MERITLNSSEKEVLRMIAGGLGKCPAEYPLHTFNAAVRSLEGKRLVHSANKECGNVADAMLTQVGRQYLAENPNLRNPINWVGGNSDRRSQCRSECNCHADCLQWDIKREKLP